MPPVQSGGKHAFIDEENKMKKTFCGAIGLLTGLILCSVTALAQEYSSVSISVTKNGSSFSVSNYSALSGYKVSSSSKNDDILTIKMSAGSGNSWSSKMKKSGVSIFGDYTNSDIEEFERVSSSQITIKLDVSEDAGNSAYVETTDKDSVNVSSSTSSKKSGSSSGSSSSSKKSSKSTKVTDVTLNAETGRVTWSGNADEYDIIFYKDGVNITKVSTKKEKYDFHNYFSDAGIYSVAVRADNGSDDRGNYAISNVLNLTSEQAAAIKANIFGTETVTEEGTAASAYTTLSPTADANGSWQLDQNGWWYLNSDGSYTVNNWQQIGDKWYYFNQNGYMQTGWVLWQGAYYYLGDYGMLTNSWTPDGYYVGNDGRWLEALGHNPSYGTQQNGAYDMTSQMILGNQTG